jgi:hypothetical protein
MLQRNIVIAVQQVARFMENVMDAQIQNFVDNVVVRARSITGGTVTDIRSATREAAGKVKSVKGTVHEVGKRGLKLNEMAFHYLDKLIKLQLKFVESTIDEGAKRLTTAANAPSLGKLVKDQVNLLPMTRDRITNNARDTLGLVMETRDGVVALFKPAAKAKAVRKAPAKKAATRKISKKAVRKAPVKKASVRKVSAKKAVAKKPVAAETAKAA